MRSRRVHAIFESNVRNKWKLARKKKLLFWRQQIKAIELTETIPIDPIVNKNWLAQENVADNGKSLMFRHLPAHATCSSSS